MWYDGWKARRVGRKDAKRRFPDQRQLNDPNFRGWYVRELKQVAEENLRRLAAELENCLATLRGRETECQELVRAEEEKLRSLRTAIGAAHHRALISKTGHWLFLAILFVGEFPLNALAFELFGESQLMTYAVTAGLATAICLCAYFVGGNVADWHIARDAAARSSPTTTGGRGRHATARSYAPRTGIWLAVVLTVLVVAVIIGVAYMRERYLAEELGTAQRGITIAFVAIQLLIFGLAVALSYAAHDPLRDQEARYNAAKASLAVASQQLQNAHKPFQYRADDLKDRAQRLMEIYEGENNKHRPPEERVSFPMVAIDVPQSLRT